MGKQLDALKAQVFSWNPVFVLVTRLLRFGFGATLTALSALMIWRAGNTALAQGVWIVPAIPEA